MGGGSICPPILSFASFIKVNRGACLVLGSGRMFSPPHFLPDRIFNGRETRIAFGLQLHPCDYQPIRPFDCLLIDLGSSDYGDLVHTAPQCVTMPHNEGSFYAWRNKDTGRAEIRIAAHDDVRTTGKGLANRGIRLSAHDHGLSYREPAEMLQVGLEPPRQTPVLADDAIQSDRCNEYDLRPTHGRWNAGIEDCHTATLALIWG